MSQKVNFVKRINSCDRALPFVVKNNPLEEIKELDEEGYEGKKEDEKVL